MLILLLTLACSTSTPADPAPSEPMERHEADAATAAKTTYTCPMHPEITSDEPGTCSKCGMDLVASEASDDHSAHDH